MIYVASLDETNHSWVVNMCGPGPGSELLWVEFIVLVQWGKCLATFIDKSSLRRGGKETKWFAITVLTLSSTSCGPFERSNVVYPKSCTPV